MVKGYYIADGERERERLGRFNRLESARLTE